MASAIRAISGSSVSINFKHTDGNYIVACGRISHQKGFDLLVRALSLLPEKFSNIPLIIIGDGEERGDLEYLIKSINLLNPVIITGYLSNPLPIIRMARLFVLSSRYEGFGNVLAEALALKVPCISFDCKSGPYDILLGGQLGKLVPDGDIDALSRAIIDELSQKSIYSEEILCNHLKNFNSKSFL